jgi:hypothetical protein
MDDDTAARLSLSDRSRARPNDFAAMRARLHVHRGDPRHSSVGRQWACLRLFRHLAIDHQHGDDDHHVPHGVPDPEHSKPRHHGDSAQAGRTYPRERERPSGNDIRAPGRAQTSHRPTPHFATEPPLTSWPAGERLAKRAERLQETNGQPRHRGNDHERHDQGKNIRPDSPQRVVWGDFFPIAQAP